MVKYMYLEPIFFQFTNLIISLFGFVTLYTIWRKVQRKTRRYDFGYLFLARAILVWIFSSLLGITCVTINMDSSLFYKILASGFSTLNNAFLLCSIFFFEFAPSWFQIRWSKRSWYLFVGILSGAIFILTTIFLGINSGLTPMLALSLDMLFSAISVISLGVVFFRSFKGRKLIPLAYLTFVALVFIISTEIIALFGDHWWSNSDHLVSFMILISHVILIFIFLASVFGWFVESSSIPNINQMKVSFDLIKDEKSLLVKVTVDGNFENIEVPFTSATYLYFLKFAIRKKYSNEGLVAKEYYHANYPSRIEDRIQKKNPRYGTATNPIANAALEKWPFFFEKTFNGHILRLLPENIDVSSKLILDQLNKIGFDGFPESDREIKFIQDEYKRKTKGNGKR